MKQIPTEDLNLYLGEKVLMESDSRQKICEVIIKEIKGELIWGINKTNNSLFEVTNPETVKFYEP